MKENWTLPDPRDAALNQLLVRYREALPDRDPGPEFMPGMWARIEARESSSTWFGRMAKGLVTAALAASAILGLLVFTGTRTESAVAGTYLEAHIADHVSSLEPMNLERIAELEQQ